MSAAATSVEARIVEVVRLFSFFLPKLVLANGNVVHKTLVTATFEQDADNLAARK